MAILDFILPKKSRRVRHAGAPVPALEPRPTVPPKGAAPQSCEVVDLASRRADPFVWCPPLPEYIGAVMLGAVLTTAAVSIAADAWAAQVRVAAGTFENWSVTCEP
jgi:hypothetical protein